MVMFPSQQFSDSQVPKTAQPTKTPAKPSNLRTFLVLGIGILGIIGLFLMSSSGDDMSSGQVTEQPAEDSLANQIIQNQTTQPRTNNTSQTIPVQDSAEPAIENENDTVPAPDRPETQTEPDAQVLAVTEQPASTNSTGFVNTDTLRTVVLAMPDGLPLPLASDAIVAAVDESIGEFSVAYQIDDPVGKLNDLQLYLATATDFAVTGVEPADAELGFASGTALFSGQHLDNAQQIIVSANQSDGQLVVLLRE